MIEAQETKPPIQVGDRVVVIYVVRGRQEFAYVEKIDSGWIVCALEADPGDAVWRRIDGEDSTWYRA